MEIPLVVVFLGILIFSAHIFNIIFDRTKVPNALWFLIIGIIIGPVLLIVRPDHFGKVGPVFTNVTLIIILFESGINLHLRELRKAIGSASILTLMNFLLSASVATVVAYYFTSVDNMVSAMFFGAIVGGTSSAVVIPVVKQLKMSEKGENILMLESALSDVLCLVVGLGLLAGMQEGVLQVSDLLDSIWRSFLIAALIGVVTGLAWAALLQRIRKLQNHAFTMLAAVFVVAGLSDFFGWNGGIATICFGITVGNAHLLKGTALGKLLLYDEIQQVEKSFIGEIAFILQTYFFVYVGVSVKFGDPITFALGLLVVFLIIMLRPLVTTLVVHRLAFRDRSIMSVMTPKGLIPAILGSVPLHLGLAGGVIIQDMTFSVVFFSILVCSILVIILSKDPFAIGYLKMIMSGKEIEERMKENEHHDEQDADHKD